jgi:hypothetical protein
MRTGRPARQKESVTIWLQDCLSNGPVKVSEIKTRTPAGWRTTLRVKAALDVKSRKIAGDWYWYLLTRHRLHTAGQDEEDEDPTIYTSQMVTSINWMNRQGEDESAIVNQLIKDCKAWPAKLPYPESYIRALVDSIFYGRPRPAIPDGIKEPSDV